MKGDQAAIENIARKRPNVAMGISGMLEKMDAGRRAKVKEASEWTAKAAMGVLSLPEAERPAAYQAALAEGQRLGYQIDMPPQYDRAVDGRLRQILNQTRTFENYWKDKQEGFDLVPSGGGGAAPPSAGGGGGVNPYNIGNVRPVGGGPNSGFQQPASLDDGIRLAVNNVKAYPAKFNNGQPMTLMQIGARWAPVGDGANDPGQWARNVASIGGLDPNQPLDLNDPMTAAKFARGVHGAEHGANKVLPPERYAQAITGGAAPPGIAQGDTAPPADASGTPIPTSDGGSVPREVMRMITPNLPPGTSLGRDRKTGLFKVQEGNFVVYDSNKNPVGLVPIPKAQGTDAFSGTGMENQARNALVRGAREPAFTSTPEYAAARSYLLKPRFDPQTQTMIPPEDLSQFPPATYSAQGQTAPAPQQPNAAPPQVGQPGAPPTPTPPGGIVATPVLGLPQKQQPMTEGQAKAYGFAQRMATANSLLDDLAIQGTSKRGRFLEGLPGGLGNLAQRPEFQRFEQAKRNFMNAQLRDESGAVIGPTEFMSADLQYFPQPGQETNKELLAQMAENRRQVVEAMMVKAGMLKRGERYDPPKPKVEGAEKERLVFEARKAIADGRDPNGVREKLKKLGVDPAELDAR
jgi:hypothetical protein